MAQQLTGLHAKFTGDSTSFVRATRLAQLEANKLDHKMRETKRAQDALAASGATLAKEYHRMKMETDSAFAAMERFSKAAQTATRFAQDQKWTAEQLNAELARLANHYGVAEAAGYSMNEQVRSARFHTANLAAQFNDIGVMLAAGQSPFMLAVQQGTQITQVLSAMGGGVKQTFTALGSAFASLVSPMSLLTIGLIAGGAALVQWGVSAWEAANNTDALKKAAEEFTTILDNLRTATERLRIERGMLGGLSLSTEQFLAEERMTQLKQEQLRLQNEAIALEYEEGRATSLRLAAKAGELATKQQENRAAQQALQIELDRLAYQQQLDTAARRRANEYRDNAKKEFDERERITNAHAEQIIKMGEALNAQRLMTIAAEAALGKFDSMRTVAAQIANELQRGADETFRMAQQQASLNYGKLVNQGISGPDAARFSVMGLNAPGVITGTLASGAGGTYKPPPGQGGGGGAASNAIQSQLEQLQQSLMTQEQLELESYQRRQEVLDQALQQRLISQQEHASLMEQVEKTHQFAMLKEQNKGVSSTLSALGNLFQGSKKIGAAVAVANSWMAFTEVLKDPSFVGRPWARFAAAASALSAGFNAVRNIKAAQPGGSTGGAGGGGTDGGAASAPAAAPQTSSQVALQLVGGDMFSRDQVMKLINAINDATADGARIILR